MPDNTNIASKTSRGIAYTAGGLWGRALLQTVSTVVLARLLSPSDFGLLAMVTAIIGVTDLVRDFGMTGAIIQSQELTEKVWRSVQWFALLVGLILAIVIAACAPLIADLYNEPRLVVLTLVMAPGFLINSLMMPMQAKATREMRFGALATIDVLSMAAGVVVGIIAALFGLGVWALLIMGGGQTMMRLGALFYLVRPHYGPPKISREVWPLVGRGGSIFGAELLGYAEKNFDNVIVGQQLGPAVLGQYSRAYSLFLLPIQQMNGPMGRVALPVLSSLRNEPERYRRYIRSAVLVIGYLTLPTYAVAGGIAHPLIRLVLGPGWDVAATIFTLLAIAGFAQALIKVRTWLYISLGHSHRQFAYDLVAKPIIIAGYFVGIMVGGINGLVIVYGSLSLILLVPGFAFAIRGTFVKPSDIAAPIARPAIMAAIAFAVAYSLTQMMDFLPIVEVLLGGGGALLAISPLFLIPQYRKDVATIIGFVQRMRRPKPTAGERVIDIESPATDPLAPEKEIIVVEQVEPEPSVRDADQVHAEASTDADEPGGGTAAARTPRSSEERVRRRVGDRHDDEPIGPSHLK